MDFQATLPQRRAKVTASFSARNKAEENYWKSFRSSIFIKSYAPIVNLQFSQTSPYRYAVTSGTRIQIYSSKTNRVVKTISKFKEIARSGHIRDDGKLVVAADDSGLVQVFDINSRAVLRSIKAHKQPVHITAFSPKAAGQASPSFLTASDDTTLKLYDLATSSQIAYLAGHADYVRTAAYIPGSPHLIVSGSYDGTVKVWDTRIGGASADQDAEGAMPVDTSGEGLAREVLSLDHGYPVEKVLVHPNGAQVISAGGSVIRVWDILSAARCVKAMSNHQKTVTCLEWGDGRPYSGVSDKNRLLSAGLDGLIKSYDIEDNYRVGKTMRVGAGVISLAMAPDEGTLLIGTSTGELTVRQRQLTASQQATAKSKATTAVSPILTASSRLAQAQQAERLRLVDDPDADTQNILTATGEIKVIGKEKRKRLKEWDKLLKAFRYSDALDVVVTQKVAPAYAFALINELMHRDGLHIALNSRNEVSLLPILRFLYDHIADPTFGTMACDVLDVVLELYKSALGQSPPIDNMIDRLRQKARRELVFFDTMIQTRGQIEMIMAVHG